MCSFSEVHYEYMWYDVFGEGWAISNSEKGSSGVGYVGVIVIWRGRGREGILVLLPYAVAYAHERVQ